MLVLKTAVTYYGSVQALKGISLHVNEGEIVALIGANGAGKTTTLRSISGLLVPRRGTITFGGHSIVGKAPEAIVRAGVSQVPEGRQVFGPLSVTDNLLLGAYHLSWREKRTRLHEDFERIYSLFPVLRERANQAAGTLSGGEQQMLAIGRALMSRPRLLLLDEPSLGLAPRAARTIFEAIPEFRDQGLTVLLVEQNARAALQIADRAYVLETGSVVMEGSTQELLNQREVQRAYLGRGYRQVWEEG
ncbi:MAG: ABC transporter ATP-binding protein [Proteobacteria bacterium]|nr:ABC transporter ATP-binding protein [Pseudomonadota bacterium]